MNIDELKKEYGEYKVDLKKMFKPLLYAEYMEVKEEVIEYVRNFVDFYKDLKYSDKITCLNAMLLNKHCFTLVEKDHKKFFKYLLNRFSDGNLKKIKHGFTINKEDTHTNPYCVIREFKDTDFSTPFPEISLNENEEISFVLQNVALGSQETIVLLNAFSEPYANYTFEGIKSLESPLLNIGKDFPFYNYFLEFIQYYVCRHYIGRINDYKIVDYKCIISDFNMFILPNIVEKNTYYDFSYTYGERYDSLINREERLSSRLAEIKIYSHNKEEIKEKRTNYAFQIDECLFEHFINLILETDEKIYKYYKRHKLLFDSHCEDLQPFFNEILMEQARVFHYSNLKGIHDNLNSLENILINEFHLDYPSEDDLIMNCYNEKRKIIEEYISLPCFEVETKIFLNLIEKFVLKSEKYSYDDVIKFIKTKHNSLYYFQNLKLYGICSEIRSGLFEENSIEISKDCPLYNELSNFIKFIINEKYFDVNININNCGEIVDKYFGMYIIKDQEAEIRNDNAAYSEKKYILQNQINESRNALFCEYFKIVPKRNSTRVPLDPNTTDFINMRDEKLREHGLLKYVPGKVIETVGGIKDPFLARKLRRDQGYIYSDDITVINPKSGNSHLLQAVLKNNRSEIFRLLRKNADINVYNNDNISCLIAAAKWDSNDILETLLLLGADVNLSDNEGKTALYFVRSLENVELLLEYGVNVNAIDIYNNSVLTNVFEYSYDKYDAVKLLLDYGADVNSKNSNGETLLFLAFELYEDEKNDIITLLLEYGADISIVTNDGKTIFDYMSEEDEVLLRNYIKENTAESEVVRVKKM